MTESRRKGTQEWRAVGDVERDGVGRCVSRWPRCAPHDHCASTCASTASVYGSQNVIPMARIHRHGRRELSTGLLPLAGRGIQQTEPRWQRAWSGAHAQHLGQGEGLTIRRFRLCDFCGLPQFLELPKQAQGIGFVCPYLRSPASMRAHAARPVASATRPISMYASPT